MLYDGGQEFVGKEFDYELQRRDICGLQGGRYRPERQAVVERQNAVIKTIMRKSIEELQRRKIRVDLDQIGSHAMA